MNKYPLNITLGIIPVYARIVGPRQKQWIKMALDSGATYTLIPIETAIATGYNPVASKRSIEISTASGIVLAPIIIIKSLICFGKKMNDIEVVCHNLPPQSPVRGLLGLNFMKDFNLHLLFKNKILEIE